MKKPKSLAVYVGDSYTEYVVGQTVGNCRTVLEVKEVESTIPTLEVRYVENGIVHTTKIVGLPYVLYYK